MSTTTQFTSPNAVIHGDAETGEPLVRHEVGGGPHGVVRHVKLPPNQEEADDARDEKYQVGQTGQLSPTPHGRHENVVLIISSPVRTPPTITKQHRQQCYFQPRRTLRKLHRPLGVKRLVGRYGPFGGGL
jgi:hypothetical protein